MTPESWRRVLIDWSVSESLTVKLTIALDSPLGLTWRMYHQPTAPAARTAMIASDATANTSHLTMLRLRGVYSTTAASAWSASSHSSRVHASSGLLLSRRGSVRRVNRHPRERPIRGHRATFAR